MSMSPDVCMDKNIESELCELHNEVERIDNIKEFWRQTALNAETAISYLEDRFIDLEEELAKRDIVITKYQKLFEETNAALKKIGI